MKENFAKYKKLVLEWYYKRSAREKYMLAGPLVLVLIIFLHAYVYTPAQEAFAKQAEELEKAKLNMSVVAPMLDKHARLFAKREEIEKQYKEIEIKESGRTLLERLIHTKLDLPPSNVFVITPGTPQQFGGNYEKTPFNVTFSVTDLGKLAAFLDEVVHGSQPMIIRSLDMKKRGDRVLDVVIDVSGIRRL